MRHESWNLSGPKTPADPDEGHAALAAEFDAWADAGRGESMERGHMPTAGQALARIPFTDVHAFLDLGTGNGYAVRHAAQQMPSDGVAVGLDVSPRMLDVARTNTAEWQERRAREGLPVADIRFIEAPFDRIPLPAGSMDVVFSNEAIYYAPDVAAALHAVHEVLRPGGRFFCSLDHYAENTYSHDWAEKVGVPMVMDTEAGWVARFEAAGFQGIETSRLLDPSPAPAAPEAADAAALAAHQALVAWKKEIGTLLVVGTRP